jgi:hypothetical protein
LWDGKSLVELPPASPPFLWGLPSVNPLGEIVVLLAYPNPAFLTILMPTGLGIELPSGLEGYLTCPFRRFLALVIPLKLKIPEM